jgi:membrane protein
MRIIRADRKFKLNEKIKNLVLPGFDGIPIREVFEFVIRGFRKGVLVTRASSIAFNLLMAILPATIFLFTLIPFIPIPNFQQELIKLFESIFPANAYFLMENTIIDIVTIKSGGLCWSCSSPL